MKQIFILEREEIADLRRGAPLKIVLGDQTITLQAEVSGGLRNVHKENVTTIANGKTITQRVFDHLREHGGATAAEIARALGPGINRLSVQSALVRYRGTKFKRSGRRPNLVWNIR